MGGQSFTNQGGKRGEQQNEDTSTADAELPSFRPVPPPALRGAARRAAAVVEPAEERTGNRKHFLIRENHREASSAAPQLPAPPVTTRAAAGVLSVRKKRATGFVRSFITLLIGAGIGYVSSSLLHGPSPSAADEMARPRSERWSAAKIATFMDEAERQIAVHQLDAPAGNNALETYRRLAARAPDGAETRSLGQHLSLAFWSEGVAATQRGDWAEATRYFDLVKTLPVPHTSLFSAEAPLPARGGDGEAAPAALPAESAEAMAKATASSLAPPTKAIAIDDSAREAASVALRRGDAAMRVGDIVSARRFYEFAAAAGIAEAARAAGQTYDPAFLSSAGVRGVKANAERARGWYEKAARQGDARAAQLQQALGTN